MGKVLLTIAAALLVVGCAGHEPIYPVGSTLKSPITFGSKQIPLPDGDWQVYAANVSQSTLGNPIQQLVLVNRRPNAEAAFVEISTNVVTAPTGGWKQLNTCWRKDLLFVQPPPGYSNAQQDCWFLNHLVPRRTNRSAAILIAALDALHAEGKPLPAAMLYVGYRVADTSDFITVRYFFDPRTAGFVDAEGAGWLTNQWHVDSVAASPERKAYVAKLVQWGKEWFPKVRAGLNGSAVQ